MNFKTIIINYRDGSRFIHSYTKGESYTRRELFKKHETELQKPWKSIEYSPWTILELREQGRDV